MKDNRYDSRTAVRVADELVNAKVDVAIEFQTFVEVAQDIAERFLRARIPLIAIDITASERYLLRSK